jgi:hypothetical protein
MRAALVEATWVEYVLEYVREYAMVLHVSLPLVLRTPRWLGKKNTKVRMASNTTMFTYVI